MRDLPMLLEQNQHELTRGYCVQAQEKANPDASAIYVPGNQTAKAIEEAIEAEIPLVVAVAEHVPIHDMLRVNPLLYANFI